MKKLLLTAFAIVAALAIMPDIARADVIDGEWCSPRGAKIYVLGPKVTTASGAEVEANYNRHHVDYDVPEGNHFASDHLSADQLNDDEIRVTITHKDASKAPTVETWTKRCRVTS